MAKDKAANDQAANDQADSEQQINILKIYTQNSSLEVPNVKTIFSGNWVPDLNISVSTESKALDEKDAYNILLNVKCDVKSNNENAFVIDVTQCGIFSVPKSDEQTMKHVLGVFCPNVLYPYLREIVTDLVMKAGFPQLALAPINFEMMMQQKEQESQTKQ
jgi:preprotein translocase subunit SecB